MATNQTERPSFYERQHLGAADLNSAVEYDRIQRARHFLGAHTWGIAMGLKLREEESHQGDNKVNIILEPGYAWDGFGRTIVVLSPFPMPLDLCRNERTGLVKVWLKYREDKTSPPRPGFAVCDEEDMYARVRESFEVIAGDFPHAKQHSMVTVGETREDAMAMLVKKDSGGEITGGRLICDESIPMQEFPAERDKANWLIPLGYVNWVQGKDGAPGYFTHLVPDGGGSEGEKSRYTDIKESRSFRRYAGLVAEGIHAADGVIRLCRRTKSPFDLKQNETLSTRCGNERLRADADDENIDMTYDTKTGILDLTDLVWVEGNLRAKGDVKLFGTNLFFKTENGDDKDTPFLIQRRDDVRKEAEAKKGKDLRIIIGADESSENRLAIGPKEKQGNDTHEIKEKLVVQADGNVGIGVSEPKNTLDILGNAVIGSSYAGSKSAKANGLLVEGKVGIGTDSPETMLHIVGGGDASLSSGSGVLVIGPTDSTNIVIDDNEIMARNNQSEATLHFQADGGDMKVHSNMAESTMFVVKDSGKVGIGTLNPGAKLTVNGMIESKSSGFKFPDGSIQTTALAENRWKPSGNDIYYDTGTVEILIDSNGKGLRVKEPSGFGTLEIGGDDINCSEMLYLNYYSGWKVIVGNPSKHEGLKVYGDLEVTGGKVFYSADLFVNQHGDIIEQGDVIIIEGDSIKNYTGSDNNIPIPEVDLCSKAYDQRVCGIVSEIYVQRKTEGEKDVQPSRRDIDETHDEFNRPSDKESKLQVFSSSEIKKLNKRIVGKGQVGKMVTLGCFSHCKVDADIASIKAGDLLTTSPTKGHAQKVIDHKKAVGAIIGKALESMKSGKGKIPVLVTTQ